MTEQEQEREGSAQPVRGTSTRPDPAGIAVRRFDIWWDTYAARIDDPDELEALLEWQSEVLAHQARIVRAERAAVLRRLAKQAGSGRELARRRGVPEATLRGWLAQGARDDCAQ